MSEQNSFFVTVSYIFGLGFVINSGAFLIQSWKILKSRKAKSVSRTMLCLFTVFQVSGALYNLLKPERDGGVAAGFTILFLCCLSTIFLAFKYKDF